MNPFESGAVIDMNAAHKTAPADVIMTTEPFREHDHKHPYVLKYTRCGHGRLYSEPCVDCEIVWLHEQHRYAARTIARVRDRLRELGAPKASA